MTPGILTKTEVMDILLELRTFVESQMGENEEIHSPQYALREIDNKLNYVREKI